MNKKLFGLLSFGVLAVLVLTVFASATTIALGATDQYILSKSEGTNTITITSTTSEIVALSTASISDSNDHTINFSISPATAGTSFTLTYEVQEGFNFDSDETYSITLTGSISGDKSVLYFEDTPTEYADNGDLSIDTDYSVESGYGDDTDWYPMDTISVDVDVENTNNNDKVKSIVVQWGLYDEDNDKWIIKGKEDKFSLDDGDDKTITVTFQLDKLSKMDTDNEDNYKFYVWATGENEESDEKTATYTSDEVTVIMGEDFVILNSLPETLTSSCGDEITITGEVWNIGTDDQEDVYVLVTNSALGISDKVEIGDIDSFDSQDFSYTVDVPSTAESGKTYTLNLAVYDDSDEVFSSEDDDDSEYNVYLDLSSGTCSTESLSSAVVSADLVSSAKAGQEMEITATITNAGTKTSTYSVSVDGYSDWASLESISRNSVTLGAEQSQEVTVLLKSNSDSSGEQTFNIVLNDGSKTMTQPVSVEVGKAGFSLTGLVSGLGLQGNAYLWAIGALNVLLVFIIIVVAVKVVRKK